MANDSIHSQILHLVHGREFQQAYRLAVENNIAARDSLESDLLMAEILVGVHKTQNHDLDALEKGIVYADKILGKNYKPSMQNSYTLDIKALEAASNIYNAAAVNRRVMSRLESNKGTAANELIEQSKNFSQKALDSLNKADRLVHQKKHDVNHVFNDSNRDISLDKLASISANLNREEIKINNMRIDTAFAKTSPKLALTLLSERREKYGLYNKEYFGSKDLDGGGVDVRYFVNFNKANAILGNFDECALSIDLLKRTCDLNEVERPEYALKEMRKMLDEQKSKHGLNKSEPVPEPEIEQLKAQKGTLKQVLTKFLKRF